VNCHALNTCWFSVDDVNKASTVDYPTYFELMRPWQRVKIEKNYFYDNKANIVMFDTQTQPQASSLFIYGGMDTNITSNTFASHRSWADPFMRAFGYDIYSYFPTNYFLYSQAPLIRVEYPF